MKQRIKIYSNCIKWSWKPAVCEYTKVERDPTASLIRGCEKEEAL